MPKTQLGQTRNLLLALALLLGLAGCTPPAETPNGVVGADTADGKPLVLTTFTVIADMARVVGGDEVEVQSITKVGAEIHGYEPTPSDLKNAAQAALILDNGFDLERWFEAFVERLDVPHVVLTDGIDPISIDTGTYEGLPNPHAWMSPIAGQTYVKNIAAAVSDLVPEKASVFEANATAYNTQLQNLADELSDVVGTLPENQRVLVTCEGAFSYLARDIGLTEGFLWPVNSDTQGTPQQIKAAIELVREQKVPVVFCETTVNDGSQRQVAREAGADFGGLLYVDSLSEASGPVPSYLELIEYDVRMIAEGLKP